jgi:hypothetical protein
MRTSRMKYSYLNIICYLVLFSLTVFSNFRIKAMFGSYLPLVICGKDHVLFALLVFVRVLWCSTHFVLCFCSVILRLVYPMLPVSLDCRMLFTLSVFSNVYLPVSLDCPMLFILSVFSNVYLPVSLDCPMLFTLSVFSNVYLQFLWIVQCCLPFRYSLTFIYSFSGLSNVVYPFGIL